jgi:hypothetical protein
MKYVRTIPAKIEVNAGETNEDFIQDYLLVKLHMPPLHRSECGAVEYQDK